MVGILLVSHGKMAEGMLDSMKLIMGDCEQLQAVSLQAGEDFEDFRAKLMKIIRSVNSGDGVLVFVDLYGASPFNASCYASMQLKQEDIAVRILAGMNLSMLLESVALRASSTLEELVQIASRAGRDGICEPVTVQDEESDGDY